MKKNANHQAEATTEPLSLTNHLLDCGADRKGRTQATAKIFNDLCIQLKKQNNSPKDVIDDIKYLISDYLENANVESYSLQEG